MGNFAVPLVLGNEAGSLERCGQHAGELVVVLGDQHAHQRMTTGWPVRA